VSRARWRVVLGLAIVAATVYFLGSTISGQWHELQSYEWSVEPVPLVASILLLLLVFTWGVWVWKVLLRHLHVRVPLLPLTRLWFLSTLARYVPGKVWQFVGAAQLGRTMGVDPIPLVTSMLLQVGFLMVAATLVGLPFLVLTVLGTPATAALTLLGVLVLAAAGVHPATMNAALRLVPRALHRDVLTWSGTWTDGLGLLGLFVLSWLGSGSAFALFVSAVVPVPWEAVPSLIAANALAVTAGMLVFVVPAGLGAREAALTLLLSPFAAGAGVAALLAVASRLWVIVVELLGALLTVSFRPAGAEVAAKTEDATE
jgi:uncharacterized membrane protein YbhN (UPF0104 family)